MTTLDPEQIDLATLAWLAGAAANAHLLERIRGAAHPNVRNAHGYVFQHLLGGPVTIGELADRLGVTQQAASKVVAELEGLRYVTRRAATDDSRVRHVTLTRRGFAVIERGRAARATLEAQLEAELGAAAMREARRALVALLDATGGTLAVVRRRVKPPSA